MIDVLLDAGHFCYGRDADLPIRAQMLPDFHFLVALLVAVIVISGSRTNKLSICAQWELFFYNGLFPAFWNNPHKGLEQLATYLELKQQAEALLQQAEAMRKTEVQAALTSIRQTLDTYGLTVSDLQRHLGIKTKSAKVEKIARYRDSASGKTWTGHGRAPGWMPAEKADWDQFKI